MPTSTQQAEGIRKELQANRTACADPVALVLRGQIDSALNALVFFSSPSDFALRTDEALTEIEAQFASATLPTRRHALHFVADLAIWLRSFLPAWNLRNRALHGARALSDRTLLAIADRATDLAIRLERSSPSSADELLRLWRSQAGERFAAEGVADPADQAAAFVGQSMADYLDNLSSAVRSSNVRRLAEMQVAGTTPMLVGNDNAAFLRQAMFVGASFVTCNPPLVDLAWRADPERWDGVVDNILAAHPHADSDDLARMMTLEVVLGNMLLLRPVYLLTGGKAGCVCLQVNPNRHDDAPSMLADARTTYADLQARFAGGIPNVVFKLPGTQAGLAACRELTAEGIGVTITVNFGLFQHLPFAAAIQDGQAILSTLAHMSGRLAFPVRDELLGKLGSLASFGIDEGQARYAAAWSGVAVLKRLHSELDRRGFDPTRVRPLIASLRVYDGEGYRGLPSTIPDITETVGTGVITIYPNIRRAFDAAGALELDPRRIDEPVPEAVFGTLRHSEIFKQAYWTADGQNDPRLRPAQPLDLADTGATAGWLPVRNTLAEFVKAYDGFVARIIQRRANLRPASRESVLSGGAGQS